ncbi:MAG TPA: hypothetical protein VIH89_04530, partial [Candidatus Sulfotelmatobacter sp.]
GGVVAINAIHLDQMPAFDYDKLLWGERQIRSVANMTRTDARDFSRSPPISGYSPRQLYFLWIRPTKRWPQSRMTLSTEPQSSFRNALPELRGEKGKFGRGARI